MVRKCRDSKKLFVAIKEGKRENGVHGKRGIVKKNKVMQRGRKEGERIEGLKKS